MSPQDPMKPPDLRSIVGAPIGVLDPSQSARLLSVPGSTISFASFHPLTASADRDLQTIRRLSLTDELSRPKRVVVETILGHQGQSFWRFVPRARRDQGVQDEGSWPRVVFICGERIFCSQDQWDLYKLDPEYDCYIPLPPQIPIITRRPRDARQSTAEPVRAKRPPPLSTSDDDRAMPAHPKRFRQTTVKSDESTIGSAESDSEVEVEEIVADNLSVGEKSTAAGPSNGGSRWPGPSDRLKQQREKVQEARRQRRQKNATYSHKAVVEDFHEESDADVDADMEDADMEDLRPDPSLSATPLNAGKRKASFDFMNPSPDHASFELDDLFGRKEEARKRHRTHSPSETKRDLHEKYRQREQRRMQQTQQRWEARRAALHQQYMADILGSIPEAPGIPFEWNDAYNGTEEYQQPSALGLDEELDEQEPETEEFSQHVTEEQLDEDALRQIRIEESRRKLAELEKDRPLWEEQRRRREAQERAAEEALRAKKEAERRRTAEADMQRQRAEARRRQAEEAAAAEQARLEQERRRLERERQHRDRWAYGTWTTQRALERYKMLSDEFDATRFTADNPATFDCVPWPVLRSPVGLTVEDISWGAVEAFFAAVRRHMKDQDYPIFVEKSHKRFHPDRWRARGILRSVRDEDLKGYLDIASNTVAQALTPLWLDVKNQ